MKLPKEYQASMAEDAQMSDEERAEKRKRENTPLPAGAYVMRCIGTEDREATEKGKYDQVVFKWQPVEPEEDEDGNDLTKRQLWDFVSMSPNASWKMRSILDAAGFEYDSDTDELAEDDGAEVIIVVRHRKQTAGRNKGQTMHEAAEYHAPDSGVPIGFDED